MIWVGWREQRTETLIAAGVLALLAAVLVPTGLHMSSAYDRAGLAACLGDDPSLPCRQATDAFVSQFHSLSSLIAWLTLVPGLIGVLLSAPFALQFEHGTNRLDWTQSITRARGRHDLATRRGGPRRRVRRLLRRPRFVDTWLRPRFLTPHELTWNAASARPRVLLHAWTLDVAGDRDGANLTLSAT